MISKDQFCKVLIQKFERTNGRKADESDITQSSNLAVAMEHLGLLHSKTYVDYAAERAGVLYLYCDEEKHGVSMLTVREVIDMLPESVELRTE